MKNFWDYWKENIKQSKESFDYVMLAAAGFFTILCVASPKIGFPDWVEKTFPEHKLTWMLGYIAGFFYLGWCFVWLPFRRHESLMRQMPYLAIKATAGVTKYSSVAIEVVNCGNAKIYLKELEATFSDGTKDRRPPVYINSGPKYTETGFELKEYGDLKYVESAESLFNRVPSELVLIDSFGNRYPVDNVKEAMTAIAHTRPPSWNK